MATLSLTSRILLWTDQLLSQLPQRLTNQLLQQFLQRLTNQLLQRLTNQLLLTTQSMFTKHLLTNQLKVANHLLTVSPGLLPTLFRTLSLLPILPQLQYTQAMKSLLSTLPLPLLFALLFALPKSLCLNLPICMLAVSFHHHMLTMLLLVLRRM